MRQWCQLCQYGNAGNVFRKFWGVSGTSFFWIHGNVSANLDFSLDTCLASIDCWHRLNFSAVLIQELMNSAKSLGGFSTIFFLDFWQWSQ